MIFISDYIKFLATWAVFSCSILIIGEVFSLDFGLAFVVVFPPVFMFFSLLLVVFAIMSIMVMIYFDDLIRRVFKSWRK